jgi:hypothetical protein
MTRAPLGRGGKWGRAVPCLEIKIVADTGFEPPWHDLSEFRHALGACREGIWASGAKHTAGWWVQGTWDVALQHDAASTDRRIGDGSSGKQSFGVRVQRNLEEICRLCNLHDPAQVHDRNSL